MTRTDRILAFAAIASVVMHLIALLATPGFDLYRTDAKKPPLLEARIVAWAPVPTPIAPQPAKADAARAHATKTDTAKLRRPAKERAARARSATPPAPRWIVRPDDLGTVPPTPDGGLAEAAEPANAAGVADSSDRTKGSSTAAADAAAIGYPVQRARLVYDLYYAGGPVGTVTHTWFTDGHTYRVESVAEGAGLVKLFYGGKFVQRSTGRLGPDGLIPIEYTLQRGSAARRESAQFDWGAGKLLLAWKNEHRVVDLPAGTQDALSVMHQAYFMPPAAASAPLEVATSRKLAQYNYELVGDTLIETPIGILRTVHIRRADDDGMRIDVWLDRDRSLLPVRIRGVDRRGQEFEQMIRRAVVEK